VIELAAPTASSCHEHPRPAYSDLPPLFCLGLPPRVVSIQSAGSSAPRCADDSGSLGRSGNNMSNVPWMPQCQNRRQPYRLIFLLLRETGMRVGEVLELRWGDVTLDAGPRALRVREAKNGVERTSSRTNGYASRIRGHALSAQHMGVPRPITTSCSSPAVATRVSYDALHYQWGQALPGRRPGRRHGAPGIRRAPTTPHASSELNFNRPGGSALKLSNVCWATGISAPRWA